MAQTDIKPAPQNGAVHEGVKVRSPKINRRSMSFYNNDRTGR